jgi:large subunit ribosomal protein L23
LLTEKAYAGFASKRYVFAVDARAEKTQIKAAVEEIFKGVKVAKVNVVNVRGKLKRQGRTQGFTAKFKKAYVILTAESPAIREFEGLS